VVDLSGAEPTREERLAEYVAAAAREPFDLTTGPLLRRSAGHARGTRERKATVDAAQRRETFMQVNRRFRVRRQVGDRP
jgi:hypothetical protein